MAYTSSPQFDTYKTTQIAFDGEDLFRSGDLTINRDLQIVNMYYDKISMTNKETEQFLVKRPGINETGFTLNKLDPIAPIRGWFYDVDQNAMYWVVGFKVFVTKPDVSLLPREVCTLASETGNVGFTTFLKTDNTRYVVFSDGLNLWIDDYVALTCTAVTSPDIPTPHQPSPIYIDGYILLAKTGTGDMYNSNLDDPFAWTAGDFITAEMSSDFAIKLIKAKNYVVVMGYSSLEYFYNAGVEAGSPFARNDSPYRSVGYVTGCCTIGDATYFVGRDGGMNLQVFQLNNFKVEPISTSVVERTLQTFSSTPNTPPPINFDKDGFCISIDGHTFYCLRTPQTTWAYDVEAKNWYEWRNPANLPLALEATWTLPSGMFLAITGQTSFSYMSPKLYMDYGNTFTAKYVTEEFSSETYNWKTLHRMFVVGDRHLNTGTSNIMISWSDDNGSSYSTPRPLNLFSASPFITRCGRFRKRMFKLEYTDNFPLRLRALELELNIGTS